MTFKKGNIPWNKGIPRTESTKRKISEAKKGHSVNIGVKNPMWKGNKVGYSALHEWVREHKPIPKYCSICNEYKNWLDVASINHTYTRDINDYIYLCHSCHKLLDKEYKERRGIKDD